MSATRSVREYDTPVRGTPRRATAPIRLTRRGRRLALAVAIAALALAGVGLGRGVAAAGPVSGPPQPRVVVVAPGETLWQIAARVAPQADRRATIDTVQELNGLSGPLIVPGQVLIVPSP